MTHADILVAGFSGFGRLAAVLGRQGGIVIAPVREQYSLTNLDGLNAVAMKVEKLSSNVLLGRKVTISGTLPKYQIPEVEEFRSKFLRLLRQKTDFDYEGVGSA